MDNVLITGGSGFVGYWMKQTLPSYIHARFLDSKGYNFFLDDFDEDNYKYIIHLAPVEPSRVIACAKRNNARLLYCSSGIVYHDENNTEYRQNKIKWEQECLDSGVDVVIARLFTFCGEKLDDNKAITQFTKAAKDGKPIHIWGDGSTIRSYMHGRELGRWMWSILLKGASGEAYDVGDDIPITMLQLAALITEAYGSKSEIIIGGGTDPMPVYLPVDTAKTKTRKLL